MSQAAQAVLDGRPQSGPAPFSQFAWRITSCHVVTYFIAGMLAYTIFDYKTFFETGPLAVFMRPISSKWVAAGPSLQIIRGLIFAAALYPFRKVFLDTNRGWLKLWGVFVGLAILSTAGPSPGSVEGLIYTKLSVTDHLRGLPEVLLQTLAFCFLLTAWYRRPGRVWNIAMGILTGLGVLMSLAGALLPRPESFR